MGMSAFIRTFARPPAQVISPHSSTVERMYTPSKVLKEIMDQIPFDTGLITSTGRTRLEETEGLAIFDEMMRDPQVMASMSIKKFMLLNTRWDVTPFSYPGGEPSREAVNIANFVKANLTEILGVNSATGLKPVLSAFAYGRSDCELTFRPIDTGEHKGKYFLKPLKGKNIGFIEYEMDDYGNIRQYVVNSIESEVRKVHPFKVAHYAWNSEFANPYGKPDLTGVYPWYWAKKALYKYALIFGDKYASPIPEFNLERGTLSDADYTKLENAASGFHISNWLITPKGVKTTLHQNNGTAGAFYSMMITGCDAQMAKAILSQTLTTNENSKTGTFAQSQTHENTMKTIIEHTQHDVALCVVNDMIRKIVLVNFGPQEGYPKFLFQEHDPDTLSVYTDIIDKLCKIPDEFGNMLVDAKEPWIRDLLSIPARDLEKFPFRDKPLEVPGVGPVMGGKALKQPEKPNGNGNGKPAGGGGSRPASKSASKPR